MNTQQKEMLRLVETGRNTIALIANNMGLSQSTANQELDNLVQLGLLESNMVDNQYFITQISPSDVEEADPMVEALEASLADDYASVADSLCELAADLDDRGLTETAIREAIGINNKPQNYRDGVKYVLHAMFHTGLVKYAVNMRKAKGYIPSPFELAAHHGAYKAILAAQCDLHNLSLPIE